MFPFLRFKKRGVVVVNNSKRNLGRIPVQVARELVDRKHASIVHNHPAVIGLRQARTEGANRVNSANPLINLISAASLFVSNGSRIQALNSIRFEIDNGTLCVKATNLDAYFTGFIESDKRYTFTHDKAINRICVNAHQLKKILACHGERASIHIKNGEPPGLQIGSFFVEGFSPDEFPKMPFQEDGKTFPFNVLDIAKKLDFVGMAKSDNKYRSSLSGVFFDLVRQRLVCADGNRLHTATMNEAGCAKGITYPESGVIVPAHVIRVTRFLTGSGKLIENGENLSVALSLDVPGCAHCVAGFTTIDGKFPDYDSVIPKDFASKFSASIKDILPVLHRAVVANTNDSDAKPVIVEFRNDQMIVTVNVRGRVVYRGVVQGKYTGAPYSSAINVLFLSDATQTMPCDSLEILLQSGNDQAWTLRNGSGYAAVIMPIDFSKA